MRMLTRDGVGATVFGVALTLCLVLAGCRQEKPREVAYADFQTIKMGMTQEQVTALFGPGEEIPASPALSSGRMCSSPLAWRGEACCTRWCITG